MKSIFFPLSFCFVFLFTSVSAQDEHNLTVYEQTLSLSNGSEQLVIDLMHNDKLIHTFDGMWGKFWIETYHLHEKGVAVIIDIFARDTNQDSQNYLLFINTKGHVKLFDEQAFVGANEFSVQNGQLIGELTTDASKSIALEFDGKQLRFENNAFAKKSITANKAVTQKSRDFLNSLIHSIIKKSF